MILEKKKLRIIQFCLFILGFLVIFFTYLNENFRKKDKNIFSIQDKKKINQQILKSNENNDIFYNVEYSGLDLSGNRYILKSQEAYNNETNQELVNMKNVNAKFYFKDNTILTVSSSYGIYNNKTLDMKFEKKVEAFYVDSELYSEKAEYSNSKSILLISDKVKVIDPRGTIFADKLLFDIKKKELKIESFNDNKINANVSLKWKKDLEF